jgi:hypothetical protein
MLAPFDLGPFDFGPTFGTFGTFDLGATPSARAPLFPAMLKLPVQG